MAYRQLIPGHATFSISALPFNQTPSSFYVQRAGVEFDITHALVRAKNYAWYADEVPGGGFLSLDGIYAATANANSFAASAFASLSVGGRTFIGCTASSMNIGTVNVGDGVWMLSGSMRLRFDNNS